jgi:hypothetical protein
MTLAMTTSVAVAAKTTTGSTGAFDCFAPKPGSWRYSNGVAPLAAVSFDAVPVSVEAVIGAVPVFIAADMARHGDPPKPRKSLTM